MRTTLIVVVLLEHRGMESIWVNAEIYGEK